jgi:histidine triad (HIT) family protein
MNDSIFTKIIKGEIPCHKIYEDEKTISFLDIHPLQPGHTLVVSKVQIDHLWDLEDEDYQAVMATSKKVANRLREVLNPERVGVKVVGTDVPHAHVHLFPFSTNDEFHARQDFDYQPSDNELAEIAERLRFSD